MHSLLLLTISKAKALAQHVTSPTRVTQPHHLLSNSNFTNDWSK